MLGMERDKPVARCNAPGQVARLSGRAKPWGANRTSSPWMSCPIRNGGVDRLGRGPLRQPPPQPARGTSGSIGLLARLVVIAREGMSARTEANCAAVVGGEFSQLSRVGYPVRPGLVPFLLCACLPYLLETRSLTGKQLLFPSGHQGKGGLRAARPGKAPSESGAGSLTPPCA